MTTYNLQLRRKNTWGGAIDPAANVTFEVYKTIEKNLALDFSLSFSEQCELRLLKLFVHIISCALLLLRYNYFKYLCVLHFPHLNCSSLA